MGGPSCWAIVVFKHALMPLDACSQVALFHERGHTSSIPPFQAVYSLVLHDLGV